jgi:hypothetical protein
MTTRRDAGLPGAQCAAGCAICGTRPTDAHHITGRRAPDGPYLDPDLVIPLCGRHHQTMHVALRAAGLDWPDRDDVVSLIAYRARRLGVHARVIADARRPLTLEPKAGLALVRLLVEMTGVIERETT